VGATKLPSGIEGGSIVELLANGSGDVVRQREAMVFHFPHYQSVDGPHSALFLGDFKLLKFYEDNRIALFNITIDVSESNDLSQKMPSKAAELDALLTQYLLDVNAQMARPNPHYKQSPEPTSSYNDRSVGAQGSRPGNRKQSR
jgi:hypothetical protein